MNLKESQNSRRIRLSKLRLNHSRISKSKVKFKSQNLPNIKNG